MRRTVTGITGDERAKECIRDVLVYGIFIAIDVNLTSDIMNGSHGYWVDNNTYFRSNRDWTSIATVALIIASHVLGDPLLSHRSASFSHCSRVSRT